MRVLVTGATGFIGRYVVAELDRRGHEVTALVRSAPERQTPGVRLLQGDLRKPVLRLTEQLRETDAIVHLAGGSGATWRATFDVNVTATERLLEAAAAASWRGRFVHVSTFAVYAFNQLAPGSPVSEGTPLEAQPEHRDDYAWTKLLQERLVRRAADGAFELVVVRPGAVYGAERRFQHRLGRQLGGSLALFGGRNLMPLTYVENTASLLCECIDHPAAAGETFNAVDPGALRQWHYARAWQRLAADGPGLIPFPLAVLRVGGLALAVADRLTSGRVTPPGVLAPYIFKPAFGRFSYAPTRAISVLGWRPPIDRAEALRRTFT